MSNTLKNQSQSKRRKTTRSFCKIIGLVFLLGCGVSYLVFQNYEFFSALILTQGFSISALLNSVIAEFIILAATAYTHSKAVTVKVISWVLLITMIVGLGCFMHTSINNNVVNNSDYFQSLQQQKQDAVAAKESYGEEKKGLDPLKWKSRRDLLQARIDAERVKLEALNTKIVEAKGVHSENLQSIIIYNSILRIAAMIINALILHSIILQITRKR